MNLIERVCFQNFKYFYVLNFFLYNIRFIIEHTIQNNSVRAPTVEKDKSISRTDGSARRDSKQSIMEKQVSNNLTK